MLKRFKLTPQSITTIIVILIIIIGVPLLAWRTGTKKQSVSTVPRLVVANSAKGQFYITNRSGQQSAKYSFTKDSTLGWLASDTQGDLLLTQDANTPSATVLLVTGGKVKQLNSSAAGPLISTPHGSGIYFEDQSSVLAVNCPSADKDCALVSINLASGNKQTIVDLGLKQSSPNFAPTNLMGYSADDKSAYLWVDAKNKLGQLSNAIYQIDTSAKKVTASYSVPAMSAFSASLSPDFKTLAYQEVGTSGKDTVHFLNLASSKDKKVTYALGGMPSRAISWSPDSTKLLIQSQSILMPAGTSAKPSPIKSVVVNMTSGQAQLINQIADSRYGQLTYQGWLDNTSVVYQTKKATNPNDFSGAVATTAVQDTSSQKTKNLAIPAGNLVRVFQAS